MLIKIQFLSSNGVWKNTLGQIYTAENDSFGIAIERMDRLQEKHPHMKFRFVEIVQ